jgi:hypothetical protein
MDEGTRMTRDRDYNARKREVERAIRVARLKGPTLEDIEETELSIWLAAQLVRIRDFLFKVEADGVDSEMLDAIDYLIDDNDRWIDPQIARDLKSGKLHGVRQAKTEGGV